MSPAARVGATALRPTFGLVGRSGVMRLADSLDKVGPICRTAADCAAVFDAVRGPDAHDPASLVAAAAPGALSSAGHPPPTTLHGLTIGVLKSMRTNPRAKPVLAALTAAGATMVDLDLAPTTPASDAATTILLAEAAANLDGWQRSGAAGGARRQDFWPPLLRLARLVPAVEYLTAQRARTRLAGEVLACLREAGVAGFVGNATELLAVSNLVGLATVVAPLDMARVPGAGRGSPRRSPGAVGFFAPPYGDAVALAMAQAWQAASTVHLLRPPIDDGGWERGAGGEAGAAGSEGGGWGGSGGSSPAVAQLPPSPPRSPSEAPSYMPPLQHLPHPLLPSCQAWRPASWPSAGGCRVARCQRA